MEPSLTRSRCCTHSHLKIAFRLGWNCDRIFLFITIQASKCYEMKLCLILLGTCSSCSHSASFSCTPTEHSIWQSIIANIHSLTYTYILTFWFRLVHESYNCNEHVVQKQHMQSVNQMTERIKQAELDKKKKKHFTYLCNLPAVLKCLNKEITIPEQFHHFWLFIIGKCTNGPHVTNCSPSSYWFNIIPAIPTQPLRGPGFLVLWLMLQRRPQKSN